MGGVAQGCKVLRFQQGTSNQEHHHTQQQALHQQLVPLLEQALERHQAQCHDQQRSWSSG